MNITSLPEWADWLKMRKEEHYPCSQKALRGHIRRLERFSKEGHSPALVLRHSTLGSANGPFRTVYKDERNGATLKARPILETTAPIVASIQLREIPKDRSQQEQLKALARRLGG